MRDYIVVYEWYGEERSDRFAAYSYQGAAKECRLTYPGANVLDVEIA